MSHKDKPRTYTPKQFKSLLNKRKNVDTWFWDRYSINTYNGCQIGCIYCNSRKSKYHLPIDFEKDIIVKSNIESILKMELRKIPSSKKDVVTLCGSTDPYQAAERRFLNTRKCLELLLEYEFPVHIITKSRLVLRDLELLEEIAKATWCTVSVSISTINHENAKFLEPGAPSPSQRLEVITRIKKFSKNIQTGILAIPIVPYISDNTQDIEIFVQKVAQSGADYLLFAAGLTMDSTQAIWFLSKLRDSEPQLIPLYENLFSFTYEDQNYTGKHSPPSDYQSQINKIIINQCKKLDLPNRISRYIPNDQRRRNYLVAEELHKSAYELQLEGRNGWHPYAKFGGYLDNLEVPIDTIIQSLPPGIKNEIPLILFNRVNELLTKIKPTENLKSWFD